MIAPFALVLTINRDNVAEADPTLPVELSALLIAPENEFAHVVRYGMVNG